MVALGVPLQKTDSDQACSWGKEEMSVEYSLVCLFGALHVLSSAWPSK